MVNILGMHTYYELDRVAGRYADIADERTRARTIFPLAHEKPFNLFSLRQRYRFLEPLLDAEYGSRHSRQPGRVRITHLHDGAHDQDGFDKIISGAVNLQV